MLKLFYINEDDTMSLANSSIEDDDNETLLSPDGEIYKCVYTKDSSNGLFTLIKIGGKNGSICEPTIIKQFDVQKDNIIVARTRKNYAEAYKTKRPLTKPFIFWWLFGITKISASDDLNESFEQYKKNSDAIKWLGYTEDIYNIYSEDGDTILLRYVVAHDSKNQLIPVQAYANPLLFENNSIVNDKLIEAFKLILSKRYPKYGMKYTLSILRDELGIRWEQIEHSMRVTPMINAASEVIVCKKLDKEFANSTYIRNDKGEWNEVQSGRMYSNDEIKEIIANTNIGESDFIQINASPEAQPMYYSYEAFINFRRLSVSSYEKN